MLRLQSVISKGEYTGDIIVVGNLNIDPGHTPGKVFMEGIDMKYNSKEFRTLFVLGKKTWSFF